MAKVRLTKFKGVPKHTFHLHLKEAGFNNRHSKQEKNPVNLILEKIPSARQDPEEIYRWRYWGGH